MRGIPYQLSEGKAKLVQIISRINPSHYGVISSGNKNIHISARKNKAHTSYQVENDWYPSAQAAADAVIALLRRSSRDSGYLEVVHDTRSKAYTWNKGDNWRDVKTGAKQFLVSLPAGQSGRVGSANVQRDEGGRFTIGRDPTVYSTPAAVLAALSKQGVFNVVPHDTANRRDWNVKEPPRDVAEYALWEEQLDHLVSRMRPGDVIHVGGLTVEARTDENSYSMVYRLKGHDYGSGGIVFALVKMLPKPDTRALPAVFEGDPEIVSYLEVKEADGFANREKDNNHGKDA